MTRVTMIYDNNVIEGFRLDGHARYNPFGPDILCASISATSQMTLNGILDWTGLDLHEVLVECNDYYAVLHVNMSGKFYEDRVVQQMLKSFEMYMEQLTEQYPDNITLQRMDRDLFTLEGR